MNSSLRRKGLFQALCVSAFTLLLAVASTAQTPSGQLVGSVVDQSGAVLPGATVTLTNVGTNEVSTATSNQAGAFVFPNLAAGTYKVSVALEGFKTGEYTDVIIAAGREYSLTSKLALGAMAETVTVVSGASLVTTSTPEVSSTVSQQQILNIPLASRDVTNLINLQAGVPGITARANTSINGGRPTWTQVTLDGINIQDNFIRTNSLDFLPNRPTSDNVAEFAITTSVAGAESAGGASAVRMVTPSGTNRLVGSVYEFNRHSGNAANSFFNNAAQPSVQKAKLRRNQFGGRLGGPIRRDKLFYFFNYDGWRQTTQAAQNLIIPANADFYSGVFRYVDLGGSVRSINVMQLSGLTIDPKLQSEFISRIHDPSNVNSYPTGGDSTQSRILNTAGFRLLQTDINERDNYTGRLDFAMTDTHRVEGVFSYFREPDDRTDLDAVSLPRPLVFTESDPKRLALAWRWAASSNFNNELRGGFNLAPAHFRSDIDYADVIYTTALGITSPLPTFQPQGRYTDTYQLNDNASYLKGDHQFQVGGSWQRVRINPYNFANRFPTVNFGFSTTAPTDIQMNTSQFPGGISTNDLARANAMAAWLGGIVSSTSQTFQVANKTSGYVPGIPSNEFYTLDNIAMFVQDNWRWKPNFTVRAGLKWEYYSPMREDSDLGFVPQLNGRSFDDTMLDPNTTVSFVNGDFYKKDLNNFGPTVGFAWDLTKDGRTAVRGGYSLTFVNEDTATVARTVGRNNSGLSTGVTRPNLFATVSGGVPLPSAPTFLAERTLADQLALDPQAVLWGIDPDIQSPHVHQVSVGIQRELPWSMAIEARYVGNFGREIWRGIDNNQITWNQAFLDDFLRARRNGYLAQQAGLAWNPTFNSNVSGSQPLTIIPNFGIALNNATLVQRLQQNEIGGLADLFLASAPAANRAQARQTFLQNPGIYASQAIINGGFSDYNALQIELRRQFRNGFFAQVNYTFADTNTDSTGTAQSRFEPFMDNNRQDLGHGRSNFHVTHVMNANAIYELPFGQGRRWLNGGGLLNVLVGGWQVGTIVALQNGAPFSIHSGRGTFNRTGRSNCGTIGICNTAVTSLSVAEIQKLIGIFKQPDGTIYWIDPKVLNTDGRAVGPDNLDNTPGFAGQVFFNPVVGEVGNLPVMAFDGSKVFNMDFALSKRTRIGSRYNLEFKAEAFNLTNSISFFPGDRDINSANFGRLQSGDVAVGARVVQLSARFDF